ncbi:HAD family hydrolase [Cohnella ginsengisoli]|uniref:HAD family hydrolase n=1 Tax=Cohnella ginsengisoli TaxID=425004 RepID=A0A9X4QR70_9BACL|nr:HAD family hydrolase [Cohnella ginsengisoli]MDG0794540.1 HAD family hydrolase [Cohnella ginsengisoli]
MKVEGILIDFDNTLYDYERCHQYALTAVYHNHFSKLDWDFESFVLQYNQAKRPLHATLHGQAASHNRLLYFQRLIEGFSKPQEHSYSLALECYHDYWSDFVQRIELFEDVIPWLKAMRKRGLKIVMVTDLTADVQFLKLKQLNLELLLDFVVTSEEAGCEKPHPFIFELALRKSGLQPDQVCMIGDSFDKDVMGAVNLGIPAFWLNQTHKTKSLPPQVIEIQNFKEMWDYLHE